MKKIIFILLTLATTAQLVGQEVQDTLTKQNKVTTKFGFSYAVLTSRQINPNTSNSVNFVKQHPIRYTNPSSQFSFFCVMGKNKFFIKHELSYSKIHTRIYSDWLIYPHPGINEPVTSTNITDYNYEMLSYNIGFGLKLKKLNFIGGIYFGYLLSNNLSSQTSDGTNDINLQSKTFLYGVNLEINYFLSKKWFIGIGGNISSKTSDDRYLNYEYSTQSLKLSLGFYIN